MLRQIGLTLGGALMGGALLTGVLVPHASGPRVVEFGRSGPCSTCGHAAPVTITCDTGTDWTVWAPGTISDAAASVCEPGTTYTWRF